MKNGYDEISLSNLPINRLKSVKKSLSADIPVSIDDENRTKLIEAIMNKFNRYDNKALTISKNYATYLIEYQDKIFNRDNNKSVVSKIDFIKAKIDLQQSENDIEAFFQKLDNYKELFIKYFNEFKKLKKPGNDDIKNLIDNVNGIEIK
ncbi:MAG: hypothetical protein JRJ49_11230 [Deltaproteobacteria bacterium]|nr:hypothetical protein [Deltaproteobacteria bacterium]